LNTRNITLDARLARLWDATSEYRKQAIKLKKYKGNSYYKSQFKESKKVLSRELAYSSDTVAKADDKTLQDSFDKVRSILVNAISNLAIGEIPKSIDDLELSWPEIEVAAGRSTTSDPQLAIPEEIPMTDYRVDLEEAIKTFRAGFYLPSLVLCRRAYEAALVLLYKNKTGRPPIDPLKCPACKQVINPGSYIGIAKLHRWAISEGYVSQRLESVGFLLSDLGAGAAHPPLTPFKRDPEIAKLGIVATGTLLKEVSEALCVPTKA
jgi:hypothetical protein